MERLLVCSPQEPQRHINQRAEGYFYLVWDGMTMQLCPQRFARMKYLLEEGVMDVHLKEISERGYCLQQYRPGHFRLSLEDIILDLPLMDFLDLVDLVHDTARWLTVQTIRR